MNEPIDFSAVPLFPLTLGICQATEDFENLFATIRKEELYPFEPRCDEERYAGDRDNGVYATFTNRVILNSWLREKAIIMRYFNAFKNNVLHLNSTEFSMTTSWGTKTVENGRGDFHFHSNSAFSGILYMDTIENGAPIEFESRSNLCESFLLNDPSEWTVFNSTMWKIDPEKNWLLFFPSKLQHRIGFHQSKITRYSLAFNFMPIGGIGTGDSSAFILTK